MRHDNGWALSARNHIGHGVSLTRTGHTEQQLTLHALLNATHQFFDSLRLITCWGKVGH